MKPKLFFLLVALIYGLLPTPAQAIDPSTPAADARCPVCGMFVKPYPNWLSGITFANGDRLYFDGPNDLFRYLRSGADGNARPKMTDIQEIWVTEYYTVKPVAATEVYFIAGSDILGPMGKELVPVRGEDAAKAFKVDHAGKAIFRFDGKKLVEMTE